MVGSSYFVNNRFLPYLFLIMIVLVGLIALLLLAAVNPEPRKIFLIFLLIGILASIVMVSFWYQKDQYQSRKISDYSLK
ncbi:MAG: hypothetical protein ACXAD7_00915 [Candidatus Kariarchaeaceae archaeon]